MPTNTNPDWNLRTTLEYRSFKYDEKRKEAWVHIRRNLGGEMFAWGFEPKTSSIDPQQLWEVILSSCPWIFWKGPTPFLAHLTGLHLWLDIFWPKHVNSPTDWPVFITYKTPFKFRKPVSHTLLKYPLTYGPISWRLMALRWTPIWHMPPFFMALFIHSALCFWGRSGVGVSCTRGEVLWHLVCYGEDE